VSASFKELRDVLRKYYDPNITDEQLQKALDEMVRDGLIEKEKIKERKRWIWDIRDIGS
jgi:hypothetical protein